MGKLPQDPYVPTLRHRDEVYEWFGLRLVRDDVELPGGVTFEYTYVDHPGSVIVVPRLVSGDYVLVEQYRYPIRERSLELPAGSYERGEDATDAARRELLEEASLHAADIRKIGRLAPSNGFCSEWMTVFLADGLMGTPEAHTVTTARERHAVIVIGESELLQHVRAGRITDGATLSALMMLFVREGRL